MKKIRFHLSCTLMGTGYFFVQPVYNLRRNDYDNKGAGHFGLIVPAGAVTNSKIEMRNSYGRFFWRSQQTGLCI